MRHGTVFKVAVSFLSFIAVLSLMVHPREGPVRIFGRRGDGMRVGVSDALRGGRMKIRSLLRIVGVRGRVGRLEGGKGLAPRSAVQVGGLCGGLGG